MMNKILFLFISCVVYVSPTAQCVSGEDGKGNFDFGWCTYEGTFKNGKPDGEGKMVYDNYTYVGHFTNGIEDGKGVIVYKKNGRKEEVAYVSGKKVEALQKVNQGEWKELDIQNVNCKSGNCNTGYGTYVFPSGNKYVGNFVNQKREGQGAFYFNDGDRFEGIFHNNEKSSGTYTFTSGIKYTGNYSADGLEANGTVSTPGGMTIPYINGKVIIPPKPKIIYVKENKHDELKKNKTTSSSAPVKSSFDRDVEANHRAVMQAEKDIQEMQRGFERQHERDRRGY